MSDEVMVVPARQDMGMMSLKQVTDRVNLIHQVLEKVMLKDTHYGTVPGCGSKMVLLKPGADVLAMTFRLVPRYEVNRTDLGGGHREFDVTCSMYAPDGTLLGQGVGSASTMEKKYRYRWEGDGSSRHKVENEDIADCHNTVLKIAKKRAHIDATLTVTGAADLFTQDLIDDEPAATDAPIGEPKAKAKAAAGVPEGCQVVVGVLDAVSEKEGASAKGKYVKYGLKVAGEWYGTFDAVLGKLATTIKGEEVRVFWSLDGKYKTAKGVELASGGSQGASEGSGGGSWSDDVVAGLLAYADGFPKMFAKGCEHVHIDAKEWKTAPAPALASLLGWLDTESSRQ